MTNIVAFAGSLRRASFNRALLNATIEAAPDDVSISKLDVAALPFFNEDIEAEGVPEAVTKLKEAVLAADALLICSPEYNAGMPALVKNTIDWLSRPTPDQRKPLSGKAVGVIGATPGRLGTSRMQVQIKASLANPGALLMPVPGVMVSGAHTLFEDGMLTDDTLRGMITDYVAALAAFADRVS